MKTHGKALSGWGSNSGNSCLEASAQTTDTLFIIFCFFVAVVLRHQKQLQQKGCVVKHTLSQHQPCVRQKKHLLCVHFSRLGRKVMTLHLVCCNGINYSTWHNHIVPPAHCHPQSPARSMSIKTRRSMCVDKNVSGLLLTYL